jgi:small-conductance mechanosensitive channel
VLITDILGDVIHIGPRSTRIITLDSDIVTIPNTKIATSVIHNYSLPNPQVRIQIPVTVSNSEDILRIKNVLGDICNEAVKNRHDIIAHDRVPTVYLTGMNKSSMTFQITVFSAGFSFNNDIQDYLDTRIIERFRKEGILFS